MGDGGDRDRHDELRLGLDWFGVRDGAVWHGGCVYCMGYVELGGIVYLSAYLGGCYVQRELGTVLYCTT